MTIYHPLRILFIAPSRVSFGELNNALATAQRLVERGAEVLFLTSVEQRWHVQALGLPVRTLSLKARQRDTVQEAIDSFHPDGVILADAHLLDLESEVIDLDALLAAGISCATQDSLAFHPQARELKNMWICQEDEQLFHGRFKSQTLIRALPETMHVFRPCPVHAPGYTTERITPLRIYNRSMPIGTERRRDLRHQLGVESDEERVIMLAKASWGTINLRYRLIKAGRQDVLSYTYETFLSDLLSHYLSRIEVPVTVMSVTSQAKRMEEVKRSGHIRFLAVPPMEANAFGEFQQACDLYVTDNIPSSAMAKAVFSDVPALVLLNTRLTGTQDGSPLDVPADLKLTDEQAMLIQKWNHLLPGGIYPFYLYPNGWIRELEPFLTNNPYCDALVKAEMYAIEETTDTFTAALSDAGERESIQARQQTYIDQVLSLPDAYDVIGSWATHAGKKEVYA